jgi:regulatory protein
MRARLSAQGYPAALVGPVLERLIELGYLDDERYAAAWIASRDRVRPRGTVALRRELARKGIDRAVIDAALAERGADRGSSLTGQVAASADLLAARRLLERRRSALEREPDPRKRRQKAYALLARNGFDADVCAEVAAGLGA